ncbi:MAG: tRNA (N(6)-L-threonylcarbamoyladenosine(37)-C(2))-methylthiotransferase MtaB [Planctomycetota bacterium]|jgi:threonylcarbamoyladenosine tRNA methylthiotransferase MtaB
MIRTFAINTLGCKVNQYESQQIRELLERLGLHQVENSWMKPNLVVVNTCCVTHTASAKSRQSIRKVQKLSPDAVIVACGCLPSFQTGELNNPDENVYLIGNHESLAATLSQIVTGKNVSPDSQDSQSHLHTIIRTENADKIKHKNILASQPKLTQLRSFGKQTRAFLKIQDGCDGCCSYCIIPKTRPNVWSKRPDAALQEAQALAKAGHREIVVTGIFLGAYGQSSVRRKNWNARQNNKLADLLEEMAKILGLARIRVSSLEPTDVTPHLLDVFCTHSNIMPHLHLSLQSGSNAVLKRMCRQYTAELFMGTVEAVKSQLDRPAITTDIIVGFPGETDDDFQQTVALAKEVGFAKIHVFSFSPRKSTSAAAMRDIVDDTVIKERSRVLRNLDIQLGRGFREQFIGKPAEILVENDNGQPCGRSERYFMVYIKKTGAKPKKNEIVRVKLTKNTDKGAIGEVMEQGSGWGRKKSRIQ